MILDSNLEFADALSVGTPNNAALLLGDVIDMTTSGIDVGAGEPIYLVIQVTTTIGSGGAATVSFVLASDAIEAVAINGDETKHWESDVFALATVVAGFTLVVPLPWASPAYERYLGFQIRENAGQALNAGAVNAFLTRNPRGWQSYAQGDVIDG